MTPSGQVSTEASHDMAHALLGYMRRSPSCLSSSTPDSWHRLLSAAQPESLDIAPTQGPKPF